MIPGGGTLQSQSKPSLRVFCFKPALIKASFERSCLKQNPPPKGGGFALALRREGDSNPRFAGRRTTVFETAAFDHSAISPYLLAALPTASIPPLRDHLSLYSYIRMTKIINIWLVDTRRKYLNLGGDDATMEPFLKNRGHMQRNDCKN